MSNNIMRKQKFGRAERYTFAQLKDYIENVQNEVSKEMEEKQL